MMDIEKIKEWLKNNLSEEKYEHSLGAMECAEELAKENGFEDIEKAKLTALIHDCAKCIKKDDMFKIIEENNIEVSNDELKCAKTLHAPVGAYIAQKEFQITDPEILSAIRVHTIGKINMTLLEKIVYLADKMEKRTREEEYLEKLQKVYKEKGLNGTILKTFKLTIKSLVKRNLPISYETIEVYNYYLSL